MSALAEVKRNGQSELLNTVHSMAHLVADLSANFERIFLISPEWGGTVGLPPEMSLLEEVVSQIPSLPEPMKEPFQQLQVLLKQRVISPENRIQALTSAYFLTRWIRIRDIYELFDCLGQPLGRPTPRIEVVTKETDPDQEELRLSQWIDQQDVTQLWSLDLSNRQLTVLSPAIGKLSALTILGLHNNQIYRVPSEIGL